MLNHKLLCCACFLLLLALGPASADEPHPSLLLKHIDQKNLDGAGQYAYEVEVDNGIRTLGKGNVNGAEGEYILADANGAPVKRVTYTADSTGFHPVIHDI